MGHQMTELTSLEHMEHNKIVANRQRKLFIVRLYETMIDIVWQTGTRIKVKL